jgi:hypothetical protein
MLVVTTYSEIESRSQELDEPSDNVPLGWYPALQIPVAQYGRHERNG